MLVVFFGDGDDHAGAIELWRNDPAESKDMTLADGHYGRTAEAFEFLSRRTSSGAAPACRAWPGTAGCRCSWPTWARARASCAAKARVQVGINRGFALACTSNDGQHHVVACCRR